MSPLFQIVSVLLLTSACRGAPAPQPTNIVTAGRSQVGKTVRYDPAYRTLNYPSGDVPIESGVCTDVVIRALRAGPGIDLQQRVHEDMKQNFGQYPTKWGLKKPDPNIDHRRVLNLQTYFKRSGWEIEPTNGIRTFEAGDLVTCIVPPNLPHIMIVSDRSSPTGRRLVLHNIGKGTQEEDRLADFRITGQYRMPNPASASHPTNATSVSRTYPNRPAASGANAPAEKLK
jgi:uncharacterized protein YijF (DUF1287 family)